MSDDDRIFIDVPTVKQLISEQFPQWAHLEVTPLACNGWDNQTYRLGKEMSVRLPRHARYATQVEKEHTWLPQLAPSLPLPISTPLAMGKPGAGYPFCWSVYQWLEGDAASLNSITDLHQFATRLAEFLNALQACDTSHGPLAGAHNFHRGGSLSVYDKDTRKVIATLENKEKAQTITDVWDTALASVWVKPPVWVHGDIAVGNLLVHNGELSAVIDFGQLGVGDPACDLAIAWTLLTKESRDIFRKTLNLDSDTWARSRGWTLWKALCAAFPGEKRIDWRVVDEVLGGYRQEHSCLATITDATYKI